MGRDSFTQLVFSCKLSWCLRLLTIAFTVAYLCIWSIPWKPCCDGVVILGMHRSGTSAIAGMLSMRGLHLGSVDSLLPPKPDNTLGFFERIDVMQANDLLMRFQNITWDSKTHKYDADRSLTIELNATNFSPGLNALRFFKHPTNHPFLMKDPRLSITLKVWLRLLGTKPAVLFTYRHPLEVALSLHRRENHTIDKSLRLWYVYNRRAIQQSEHLCRVITSYSRLLSHPKDETDRLSRELSNACGIKIAHSAADVFINSTLYHERVDFKTDPCSSRIAFPSDKWANPSDNERSVYERVIDAYCAMEKGDAFKPEFEWDETLDDS